MKKCVIIIILATIFVGALLSQAVLSSEKLSSKNLFKAFSVYSSSIKTHTRHSSGNKNFLVHDITGTLPPETGDWVISDLTIVRDTYVMVNGSIIVESSGALVIINSTLVMNLSYDGEHAIFVYGNFTVRNASIYSLSLYINY